MYGPCDESRRCGRDRTPGAGGWGDPKRRDVQKVLEDVLEGKVSPGAAASEYGVALKRDKMLWTVDEEQTDVLRNTP